MTSTRINNSKGEYNLEQQMNGNMRDNRLYELRSRAQQTSLPDAGIYASHIPNYMLSKNAVDIESQLYGIGSTNLVEEKAEVKPDYIEHPTVSFFDRLPQVLPKPMVCTKDQRPIIP